MFIKYPKIHRLGKTENDGILEGTCYIQEKIDGANVSIWMEDGELKMASRNQEITEGFNGFCDYVREHEGIQHLLGDNPNQRLYGEWLVRHTIGYNEGSYKQFYLFDIELMEEMYPTDMVDEVAKRYGILYPQLFITLESPTKEELMGYVGVSNLGEKGEGIVIKNPDFVNKFGDRSYAKIVTEDFKENNGVTFGGNNKTSDHYWEVYVVNKYIGIPRVQKAMDKLQPIIDEELDMKHIPRISDTVYRDVLVEEICEIVKKVPSLDFKALRSLSGKKAKMIYIELLNNNT